MYGATYEGVDDALEKHHNTSPACAIVTLNSSLYLDYFAHLIKQNFARRFLYTCTMIYVDFTVIGQTENFYQYNTWFAYKFPIGFL